jgi:putative transposase
MPKRAVTFFPGEYYHICNRGVDGRDIFIDQFDADRMVTGMVLFNQKEPIGSIYQQSFKKGNQLSYPVTKLEDRLVDIICYCFNPNHFHLILRERVENGVVRFMHDFAGGYARYLNCRHTRTGVLYQGRFRANHISTNEYLLWASAYVNLNDQVHQLGYPVTKLVRSSWGEYVGITEAAGRQQLCEKNVILEQFDTVPKFVKFSKDAVVSIRARKDQMRVLDTLVDD